MPDPVLVGDTVCDPALNPLALFWDPARILVAVFCVSILLFDAFVGTLPLDTPLVATFVRLRGVNGVSVVCDAGGSE